jgi:hypothetical protein
MSYIQTEEVPDFNQAIISLWFRVSKETMDAVAAEYSSSAEDPAPLLLGVIPLITFGPPYEGRTLRLERIADNGSYQHISWNSDLSGAWQVVHTETISYSTHSFAVPDRLFNINPSYIGLLYVPSDEEGGFVLHAHLQSGSSPSDAAGLFTTDTNTVSDWNSGGSSGAGLGKFLETHWRFSAQDFTTEDVTPGNPWVTRSIAVDQSAQYVESNGPDSVDAGYGIAVEPDKWHHLLISFDVSSATSALGLLAHGTQGDVGGAGENVTDAESEFSNPCKMWIALDDVNIEGDFRSANGGITQGDDFLGPNEVLSRYSKQAYQGSSGSLTSLAWGVTGTVQDAAFIGGPRPSASYSGAPLPATPFGLPAAKNMVDKVRHCEMAELQMWLGKTIDTSDVTKRRLFIDYERNADGNPVVDAHGKRTMKPVIPSTAEAALGKPDILLHTTSKWKKGTNTGSRAETTRFTPTGEIRAYKPDPSLEKDA